MNLKTYYNLQITQHFDVLKKTKDEIYDYFYELVKYIINAIKNDKKIIFFGNGSSAADAQHLATELTVRFIKDRPALPAIALTTDTSALTAIGNDFGFDNIFSRQIEALCVRGDVVVCISTSGNSENVIRGFKTANEIGAVTVALGGGNGGRMTDIAKHSIIVPSDITARIQEMHVLIGHMLCGAIEKELGLV